MNGPAEPPTTRASYLFDIFADYFQFYLEDDDVAVAAEWFEWTEESVADRLAVGRRILAVGTVRNMDVPVAIEIRAEAPDNEFSAWDHVTEASFEIPSGCLVTKGCTDPFDDAPRLSLRAGVYAARIYYGGLTTVSQNRLDGNDHYWNRSVVG